MSGYRLTPPDFSGGFKPPANLLGDFTLRLESNFMPAGMGWFAATRTGKVAPFGAALPSEDALRALLGNIALQSQQAPQQNPLTFVVPQFQQADPKVWDFLYNLLRGAGPELWQDVNGRGRNIANGEPNTIGKVDPSGVFRPTPADGVIAGTELDSGWIPGGALKLGKRFPFVTSLDVHFYAFLDKDAAQKPDYLLSGGGVGVEGKTSGGLDVKLRVGVGRDQTGGGAGFLKLQIGPDALPMSNHPGAPPPLF